jgi:glycosyltransferase involved in cell wall biosynthesis
LKFKNTAIFSIFYDRCWVVSGYLTSKILKKKYVVYCHDPFSEKYLNHKGLLWRAALKIERMVLTDKNTTTFCLNEGMKELYKKYTEATVLPHIADVTTVIHDRIEVSNINTFTIGFAGSIYSNNDECIEALLTEVKQLGNIRVKFYGNYSEDLKKRLTDMFPVEFDFKKNYDELIYALQSCDLLYLPLNFKASPDMPRECLQYVLPTKSIDFLITGKKILVHCPADYELSRFFKKWDCGYVLNSIEDGSLGKYIANIMNKTLPFDLSHIHIVLKQFQKENIHSIFIKHLQNENK